MYVLEVRIQLNSFKNWPGWNKSVMIWPISQRLTSLNIRDSQSRKHHHRLLTGFQTFTNQNYVLDMTLKSVGPNKIQLKNYSRCLAVYESFFGLIPAPIRDQGGRAVEGIKNFHLFFKVLKVIKNISKAI